MDSGDAIIIALIAIIIIVAGVLFLINGNGITFGNQNQTDDVAFQTNNTAQTNVTTNNVPPSGISSSQDIGSTPTPTQSGSSSSDSSDSSDSSSSSDTSSSSDDSSSSDTSSSSSSTPQAGQSEGTYDPTDFD